MNVAGKIVIYYFWNKYYWLKTSSSTSKSQYFVASLCVTSSIKLVKNLIFCFLYQKKILATLSNNLKSKGCYYDLNPTIKNLSWTIHKKYTWEGLLQGNSFCIAVIDDKIAIFQWRYDVFDNFKSLSYASCIFFFQNDSGNNLKPKIRKW